MIDPGTWTVRVRRPDMVLADPIECRSITLVENYGPPDMVQITGRLNALRPALSPDYGIVIVDSEGEERFSGIVDSEGGIERNGDGTGALYYAADTVQLWDRVCYPVPANDWTTAGQTAADDVQTGTIEDRILAYVNRNLGPGARTERRLNALHMPATGARGASGTSRIRFDRLGELVAQLAEQANLRVAIRYNAAGWLDLVIDDAPDLSAWARFGDAAGGGPGMLGADWSYKFGPPAASTILVAAGGEGKDRNLGKGTDTDAEALWKRRRELFVDNRGTGELPDATLTLAEAVKDRDSKLRARNNAYAALQAAAANLAAHPGNSTAQDAKDTAQDNYNTAATDYTDAVAEVATATTARTAAAAADAAEIAQAVADALAENVGAADVTVPLANTGFALGTQIPIGAKVSAELDGELITERIRQITTVVGRVDGDPTVKPGAVFGSPDASVQSPTHRKLAEALRRIGRIERSS